MEEELQTAQPIVAWGLAVTKMAAVGVRCPDNNVVAKGVCFAARVSGDRKWKLGVDDAGYGKDATYGDDGKRVNASAKAQDKGKESNNAGATPAMTTTGQCWQRPQCDAGKDASATPANASAALAGPPKSNSATTSAQCRLQGHGGSCREMLRQ